MAALPKSRDYSTLQDHDSTGPTWSPLLFDWAFRRLEDYVPGDRREDLVQLKEDWSLSRIVALHHEATETPVQVLGLLQRWEYPAKIAPEVDAFRE